MHSPPLNTLRPRQNGRHLPDDIFKCIFLNEDAWISIKISLKFVLKGPINKIPALVKIMAWRRSGNKPLSEPMMVSLLTHICVTRPQWIKRSSDKVDIHRTIEVPGACCEIRGAKRNRPVAVRSAVAPGTASTGHFHVTSAGRPSGFVLQPIRARPSAAPTVTL